MKQHLFILIFLFFSTDLFSQKLTNEQIENHLVKLYEKILSFPYGGMRHTYDSIKYYDRLFQEKLAYYTSHFPSSLSYPFNQLDQNNYISIATSKDGKLRIYSWDTWDGGTMHSTMNLLQFKIEICGRKK